MRMTGLAVLLLLAVPVIARADAFETFSVNSTAGGGAYSVTGTLTFDISNLTFTDSDLVTSFGPVTGASTASGVNIASTYEGFGDYPAGIYVVFNIPGLDLTGYTGGALCSAVLPCAGGNSSRLILGPSFSEFDGGSLSLVPALIPTSPTSLTPEPSSLLLLGTGLLGAIAAMRRRSQ